MTGRADCYQILALFFGLIKSTYRRKLRSDLVSSQRINTSAALPVFDFFQFKPKCSGAGSGIFVQIFRLVSGFLLGGVAGTYVGSILSDRLGARKILLGSITLSIPAIYCITIATTQAFAMVSVVLAGFFIIGSFATTIIIAQCMMPNNVGMASGLTIGFSVGLGGFGVTILGMLADRFGLPMVMQLLVWLPIIAAVTAIWIPIPKKLQK